MMKKNMFIVIFLCYISIYAQNSVNIDDIFTTVKKDYLYNLVQINTNTNTILTFNETTEKSQKKRCLVIKETLKMNLQIKSVNNILLKIKEDSATEAIYANVFCILLRNTKQFTEKTGNGEFAPNQVTQTYKWVLKDDLLIFIFTNRPLEHKLQQYVYLPSVE